MATGPEITGYSEPIRVARGGFAVVYRARQDRFNRLVALKVLNVDDLDDRSRRRFERECSAMGSLSWHPHVVAVHDSGIDDDGRPWLAMEYLDAGSLGDRLARGGPLSWEEALSVGVQVAGALGAAHASGVVHRDIKPENILIGPFGEAKLSDFGIAAVEGSTRTTTGHGSFTVAHVAPEALRGQQPDERSDLYGLASTLHTLITGTPPFASDADQPIATYITRVLQAPAPRLDAIPDELADLLERTLAKDPDDRPQTAEAFGRRLQDVQTNSGQRVTDLRLAPTESVGPLTVGAPDTATPDPRAPAAAQPSAEPAGAIHPEPAEPGPRSTGPVPDDQRVGGAQSTIHRAATPTPPPPDHATPTPPPADDSTPTPPPSDDSTPTRTGPPPHRRRMIVAAVAALAVGAVVLTTTRSDDSGGESSAAARTTTPTTPTTPIVATIDVGNDPEGVAATEDAVWVTNQDTGTVSRVDPATNQVVATIRGVNAPYAVAATGDAVWVIDFSDDNGAAVIRIDPATNQVVASLNQPGAFPWRVAATDDAVWVTNQDDGTVSRIDPATNQVVATIAVGTNPLGVATTGDAVWVGDGDAGTVSRIDPATNQVVATIAVGNDPGAVAATDDAVWATDFSDDTVTRIDPANNQVVDIIAVGTNPEGVSATDDAVWVTNFSDDTVTRIDPATNEVVATIAVGTNPLGVAATGDAVWVTNQDDGTVSRIDPGVPSSGPDGGG